MTAFWTLIWSLIVVTFSNEKTFRDHSSGFVVVQRWGCLPKCMDVPPMIFTGNPLIIKPGMVFFMHMILMDSKAQLAMNLGKRI